MVLTSCKNELGSDNNGLTYYVNSQISINYLGPYTKPKESGINPFPKRQVQTYLGLEQQADEKIEWLLDAKFGMFIHWGLYSGVAKEEWYMHSEKVSVAEYRKLAYPESGSQQFTAENYNPTEWAILAKAFGMKYMCLTAMHHDGFALFESKYDNAFTSIQTLNRDLIKNIPKLAEPKV